MEIHEITEPKISVIVPVYKVEDYLDRCIESIVNQTYKNLEIILIDDGSPDNCPKMCDEWAKKDNRIVVVHQNNGGRGAARNKGIEVSGGDYIGFVDGDDFVDCDFYSVLIDYAIKYDADIVNVGFKYIECNNEVKKSDNYFNELCILNSEESLYRFYSVCDGHLVSFCNKIIKSNILKSQKFPIDCYFEDWWLAPIILFYCKCILFVPFYKYNYVIRSDSAVRTESIKRYYDCVLADYYHYKFFNEKEVFTYDSFIKRYIFSDFCKCIKFFPKDDKEKELQNEAFRNTYSVTKNFKVKLLFMLKDIYRLYIKIRNKKN